MALQAGLGRTLAHTLEAALRGLDIPLENTDVIALPVEFKHAFLLDIHGFEQFFFLMLADLIRSAKTTMNMPSLCSHPASERGKLRLCPLGLRMVPAQVDAAFLKLGLKARNVSLEAVDHGILQHLRQCFRIFSRFPLAVAIRRLRLHEGELCG